MSLKLRPLLESDVELVKKYHDKYFPNLEFPDFTRMLNAFVIENEKKEFILAGGIKPIVEEYLVTNKEANIVTVGRALNEACKIGWFTCKKFNLDELLAFVYEDDYSNHLIQRGFVHRTGKPLRVKVS